MERLEFVRGGVNSKAYPKLPWGKSVFMKEKESHARLEIKERKKIKRKERGG